MTTRTKLNITVYITSIMGLLNVFSKPLHIPESFQWALTIGIFVPIGLIFYFIKVSKREKAEASGTGTTVTNAAPTDAALADAALADALPADAGAPGTGCHAHSVSNAAASWVFVARISTSSLRSGSSAGPPTTGMSSWYVPSGVASRSPRARSASRCAPRATRTTSCPP